MCRVLSTDMKACPAETTAATTTDPLSLSLSLSESVSQLLMSPSEMTIYICSALAGVNSARSRGVRCGERSSVTSMCELCTRATHSWLRQLQQGRGLPFMTFTEFGIVLMPFPKICRAGRPICHKIVLCFSV